MKGYLSVRETSYKWNVSERRVNQYVTLDASSAEMLQLFSSMDEQTKEIMLIQMRALAKRGH